MLVTTIKTHKVKPKESVLNLLDRYITKLDEKSIVAIASKVISTCENNLISKNKIKNKKELVFKESERVFRSPIKQADFYLTLKNHRFIPNAGIDESNCQGVYMLLPKNSQASCKKIWQHLRKKHHLQNLGVIITDSSLTPLRSGVTGLAIGWCGFKPVHNYIGEKDIYGEALKVTQINLLDSLATVATLNMGEGNEQTPMAIITKLPKKIVFQNHAPTKHEEKLTLIDPKKDLFNTAFKQKP
jgi:dihydrofolate synthase / folylpolyglutamate synthase